MEISVGTFNENQGKGKAKTEENPMIYTPSTIEIA